MAAAKPNSAGSLEKRVMSFLGRRTGAESIDRLTLTPDQRASEKADFLLEQRTVVCEVKALQTDTKEKIDRIMEPVLELEDAPVFYGEWELEKVLMNLPDGENIKRRIFEATTSAVWNLFRKANDQIRATKNVFGLPTAGGVLVLVNDLVPVLSPQVLAARINELFGRKEPDGSISYPEIEAVWILAETHTVDIGQGQQSVVAITIYREDGSAALRCLDALQKPWAAAHGAPLVEMSSDLLRTLEFNEVPASDGPTHGPRHERWRIDYRRNPYCRHFRAARRQVEILVVESPVGSLSADERATGGRLNTTAKLTKSFFMNLPPGSFVASHDIKGDFEPLFAELIEGVENRAGQWNRIRAAGVNQRDCHVFPSQAHFKDWQRQAVEYFQARSR